MGTYKTLYQLDVKEGLTDAWGKITNAEKKGEEGMKQYEKTAQDSFNKVGRHMDNMSQKMSAGHSKMHEGFLKMGESLPGIGRIAEYVTNPWVIGGALIAEGGKKAIESSAQFEHAFKPIRNMNLDKPMAELGEYKNQLRETAMATGQDLAGMSKAYFDYQSLTGKYGKEVNESMKKIGEFASFTDTPIIEATDAAASSMVAYGLTAKDTEKIMKSNFATVQIGLTTYSELSKVQREWAADASLAMGGTEGMDQANALYATMSAISKNPEMASIDTKTAMQSLGRGRITKKLKEVMGIDAYDAKGNMRSLLDIVKDVHKVYEKIGNNGKFSGMISELRGEQGLNHLLAMAGKNGNDLISTFEKFSSIQGGYNKEIMGANNLNDSLKQHEELLNKTPNGANSGINLCRVPTLRSVCSMRH
jgi:TP901 family phage tail tape measure protein